MLERLRERGHRILWPRSFTIYASEDRTIRHRIHALVLLGALGVAACGGGDAAPIDNTPRVVQVARIELASAESFELTGAVRALRETPLAFRIGGQIERRDVSAGERVSAGQVLFALDPRDVRQQVAAAEANLAAAKARATNAEAERKRADSLIDEGAVSQQEHDTAITAAANARESERAARAALEQARNAGAYADLVAPAAGVLMEVTGEVGQVVSAGMPVAVLAHDGDREVEVFVPETRRAALAERADARLFGSDRVASATLREVSGAADPVTRTWRARYRLHADAADWPLGATATLRGAVSEGAAALKRVPIGAIVDPGDGATVWVIREGRAEPVPVRVARVDEEHAYVETELAPDTPIVALGARLLTPGQAVTPRP
jgi:RND family efflux transporter MFP subunit